MVPSIYEKFGKAVRTVLDKLSKEVTITTLGFKPSVSIDIVSTGSLGLDVALGVGGWPAGRIIEISGPESSGKTTLALHAIAECHKRGDKCAFIDVEHALDPEYAEALGVKIDELLFTQPSSGEQALSVVEELARTGEIRMIVVDSVAALVPKAEIEGEIEDNHMGLQARLMGKALRRLTSVASVANCTIIFINQIRQKIGVMFGNPETTPGGMALKFFCSVRLDIRRIGAIKNAANKDIGNRVKVKVTKNKLAPPFKTVEFDIMYGMGVSRNGEIVDMGIEHKLIKKAGAWFVVGQYKMQGRDSVLEFLRDNLHIAEFLNNSIKALMLSDAPKVDHYLEELLKLNAIPKSKKGTDDDDSTETDTNDDIDPLEDDEE